MAAVELNSTYLISDGSLRAYYRLENANDTTANSFNLTNNGSIPFNAAKFNNGGDLGTSNTTDYFNINNDLGITGGLISVSMWLKLTTEITSGTYTFFQQGDLGTNVRYVIQYEYNSGSPRLVFNRSKTGTADEQFTYTVTLGTSSYHHLVFTYDGSTVRGYYDGAIIGSVSASGSGSSGVDTDHFYLGAGRTTAPAVANYSSAIIDDVAVFNRELTSTEIAGLYAGTLAAPAACGIDKLSTTASYNSVFRTQLVNVGTDFSLERIRIPLTDDVDSGTTITVTAYFDDGSSSVPLPTISNTLYSGQRYIVFHPPELASCKGKNNYFLQFSFTGTSEVGVGFPVEITRDDSESK